MKAVTAFLGISILYAQPDPRLAGHVRAGLAARQAGRLDEAARELEAAAKLAPRIPEIHLNLGLAHHERRDWMPAIASFETALKLKPELPQVRDLLGFDYLMLGNAATARQWLEASLKENSSNADARFWLGLAFVEQGEWQLAIRELEEARKSKPQDVDLLFYLGRAYEKASVALRQELFLVAPESARAHMAAAEYAAFNGHRDKAIEEYSKVGRIDPKLAGIQSAIAELHAEAGDYTSAERFYAKELDLNPRNGRVNFRYALVLVQLGKQKEAAVHFERAVEADGEILEAHLELAKWNIQAGETGKAERSLKKVLASGPGLELKRSAHYQYGLLERKRGRAAEAAAHFRAFEDLKK